MSHTTPRSGRMVLRPIPPVPAVGFPLPPCAPPVGAGVTLERWLELWMERDIEPFRADTTVSGYSSISTSSRPWAGCGCPTCPPSW